MALGTLSLIVIGPLLVGFIALGIGALAPTNYTQLVDKQMRKFCLGFSVIIFVLTTALWIGNIGRFSVLQLNDYAYV